VTNWVAATVLVKWRSPDNEAVLCPNQRNRLERHLVPAWLLSEFGSPYSHRATLEPAPGIGKQL
jgi:hypothetical protein